MLRLRAAALQSGGVLAIATDKAAMKNLCCGAQRWARRSRDSNSVRSGAASHQQADRCEWGRSRSASVRGAGAFLAGAKAPGMLVKLLALLVPVGRLVARQQAQPAGCDPEPGRPVLLHGRVFGHLLGIFGVAPVFVLLVHGVTCPSPLYGPTQSAAARSAGVSNDSVRPRGTR